MYEFVVIVNGVGCALSAVNAILAWRDSNLHAAQGWCASSLFALAMLFAAQPQ